MSYPALIFHGYPDQTHIDGPYPDSGAVVEHCATHDRQSDHPLGAWVQETTPTGNPTGHYEKTECESCDYDQQRFLPLYLDSGVKIYLAGWNR